MKDLIRKSSFREKISKLNSEMGYIRKADVMKLLNDEPIAYNVDKVITELKQLKEEKTLGTCKVTIKECIDIVTPYDKKC